MNPKEESRLLRLYEEVDSDIEPEEDPFTTDEDESYHPENEEKDSSDSDIEPEVSIDLLVFCI